ATELTRATPRVTGAGSTQTRRGCCLGPRTYSPCGSEDIYSRDRSSRRCERRLPSQSRLSIFLGRLPMGSVPSPVACTAEADAPSGPRIRFFSCVLISSTKRSLNDVAFGSFFFHSGVGIATPSLRVHTTGAVGSQRRAPSSCACP